ncbi:MAG: glucose-1-phosphate thymidylyltransferase [Euryarchaeota archaeon]|nr:glucose-1-phosphate thymidylyltransferase [Euryarchaeota archaeon]
MTNRKGIILAGGSGSRLYPCTETISKQLIPVYDKPMIYYPLSTLMRAKIRDILIISTPSHLPLFKKLLKDGERFGLNIDYAVQDNPEGLAQAFLLGEKFINGDPCCLILGDNLFLGAGLNELLLSASVDQKNSSIFSYQVSDPSRFGVVELDKNSEVVDINEKPEKPKSNYAVTGIYFYDNNVVEFSKSLSPSERGELEITDLNKIYIKKGSLKLKKMSTGLTWLDMGTPKSLMEASNLIYTLEKRQGVKIGCPEEVAFQNGWIDADKLMKFIGKNTNEYNNYLLSRVSNK